MPTRRFPNLRKDGMIDAQKRVYDAVADASRVGVRGPFRVPVRSPKLSGSGRSDRGDRLRHPGITEVLNVAEILLPVGVASPW